MDCSTWEELQLLRSEVFSEIKITTYKDKVIASYMARLLALTDDIFTLMNINQYSSVEILMRSVLETYIELRCVLEDKEYLESLELNAQLERRKYYKQFKYDNPFYGNESSEEVEEILSKIPNKNPMSVFDKFKKENEVDAYNTLYAFFCRFSHGGLQALASKHLGGSNVILQKQPPESWSKFVEESCLNVIVATLTEVLERFGANKCLTSKITAHKIEYA
jgi:hypothetical protein